MGVLVQAGERVMRLINVTAEVREIKYGTLQKREGTLENKTMNDAL